MHPLPEDTLKESEEREKEEEESNARAERTLPIVQVTESVAKRSDSEKKGKKSTAKKEDAKKTSHLLPVAPAHHHDALLVNQMSLLKDQDYPNKGLVISLPNTTCFMPH